MAIYEKQIAMAEKYAKDGDVEASSQVYINVLEDIDKELGILPVEFHKKRCVNFGDSIYDIETDKVVAILKETFEAYSIFRQEVDKFKAKNKAEEQEKFSTVDYLVTVVNNELWNFISHISHAYTGVGGLTTPHTYISNIEKAINHLRRAILDIYDGIILEMYQDLITPEYLSIRNEKINSLGRSKKMESLAVLLKDYCNKIRT